jgi:hypothetical protein
MKRSMLSLYGFVLTLCVLGAIALWYQKWQRDQHDRGLSIPLEKSDLKATGP